MGPRGARLNPGGTAPANLGAHFMRAITLWGPLDLVLVGAAAGGGAAAGKVIKESK